MRNIESVTDMLGKSLRYLKNLPTETCFNFGYDGGLQISADTQEDVKKIRSTFRGCVWKKKFIDYAGQWEYTTKTRSGVNIRIYGVREGPSQCKMVEETVMEEREVPLGYTKKMVEVKRVKYICPDGDKVRS